MHADDLEVPAVERVLALRALRELEALSAAELASIADLAHPHRFARGELLALPGVPLQGLHFVLEGRVSIQGAGDESRIVSARQVVGDVPALFGDVPATRIAAMTPSSTIELSRSDLEDILEDHFLVALGILRSLAGALVEHTPVLGTGAAPARSRALSGEQRLSLVDRIVALRRSMDFVGPEIEALAELAEAARETTLEPGQALWSDGDPADHLVIVVDGEVSVTAPSAPGWTLGPGTALGALELLAGGPRRYRAVGKTAGRALRIEGQALLDLIEDNPPIGPNLVRSIAKRMRDRVSAP